MINNVVALVALVAERKTQDAKLLRPPRNALIMMMISRKCLHEDQVEDL